MLDADDRRRYPPIGGYNAEMARWGDFANVVSLLERGIVTGGDAGELLARLARLMGAQAAIAGQGYGMADWNVQNRVPSAWPALHGRYRHQDTTEPIISRSPPGTWLRIRGDTGLAQLETDLNHHFCDQGFTDAALARIYNPFVDDLMLVIYRADGARTFSREDVSVLRALYPHLAGGLAARRALAALAAPASQSMRYVLAESPCYAHLSFPSGNVSWSGAARRLMQSRLGALSGDGWRRLDRMLLRAAVRFHQPVVGGRSQLLLPGLRVELAMVPPRAGETKRLLALLVEDVAGDDGAQPAEELLSPRQRLVARRLAAGRSVREIAAELEIAVETVREHASEIYRRLGVSTRAELGALLRIRPPSLPR